MAWRITFAGNNSLNHLIASDIQQGEKIEFTDDAELRNSAGQVVRFKSGADFVIESGPMGLTAVYGGELSIFNLTPMNGKYRTSC